MSLTINTNHIGTKILSQVTNHSSDSEWTLTDTLKDKITELAKKDAENNVYMGNEFMDLRKAEVSKVAPNRTALISGNNADALKEAQEADKKWLSVLFGVPYEVESQGNGSAVHIYNENGEEILTYTQGVGWQEKETEAETAVHSALKAQYYEAYYEARQAINAETVMTAGNFDAKA